MTQTAIAQTQSLVANTARELGISEGYLQLVKDVYAKNATDEELALFLRTANRLGLDPTARQIFLVKRWDSGLKREVATPQVSIDGFRAVADRTDRYVPGRESTFTYDSDGNPQSATAYIKKLAGGEWHEISATAFYQEYVQKTKEGRPNSMWAKMPHLMLAKCAESLVLRKAFPAELSGVYTAEELPAPEHYHAPAPRQLPQNVESQGPSDANPVDDPFAAKQKEVGRLCRELNKAGDDIKWGAVTLKEYVNQLFEIENGVDDLTLTSYGVLIEDLELRLENVTKGE